MFIITDTWQALGNFEFNINILSKNLNTYYKCLNGSYEIDIFNEYVLITYNSLQYLI